MRSIPIRQCGFTLIELLITVALLGITLGLAVPSILAFQRNANLTASVNSLVAAINAAKSEAIKRGRYVVITPLTGSSWSSGWRIFVDIDRNRTFSTGDIDIASGEATPTYLDVTASPGSTAADSPPYIMFDPVGYPRDKTTGFSNLTMSFVRNDVSASDAPSQTRRMILAKTGRLRSCKPTSTTDTTCAASSSN